VPDKVLDIADKVTPLVLPGADELPGPRALYGAGMQALGTVEASLPQAGRSRRA
jgi:hypothetical protein